jgi:hypothetical protein
MKIMTIPTVALIILINCSGKDCLEYLIMLKTPSMTSQRPKPIRTAKKTFNHTPLFLLEAFRSSECL